MSILVAVSFFVQLHLSWQESNRSAWCIDRRDRRKHAPRRGKIP